MTVLKRSEDAVRRRVEDVDDDLSELRAALIVAPSDYVADQCKYRINELLDERIVLAAREAAQ